jgi:hypothetical protein
MLQLICSLTSQQPFLNEYEIAKQCNVTYIQIEGELEDTVDRLKRMTKSLEFNPNLLQLIYTAPLELHRKAVVGDIYNQIISVHKPDVIIIDPVYFAFSGSLSNDDIVRQFIGNIRILKTALNCAIILVHHTHKIRFNSKTGLPLEEGDDAIFGSKFLKAYPDHTLFFTYNKAKMLRTLSCSTQRSGDIVKECSLRLVEPDPLYFEITTEEPTKDYLVVELLRRAEYKEGLTPSKIMEKLAIKRTTFYASIKKPMRDGVLTKDDTKRPVIYRIS